MSPNLSAVPTDPAAIPAELHEPAMPEIAPEGRPPVVGALTASARRITQKDMVTGARLPRTTAADWQEEAWSLYKIVGEQRFLANTLAGRMAQARIFVGKLSDDQMAAPEPAEDPELQRLITSLGDSHSGRSQIMHRMGVNLFVAGDGYLVGVPSRLMPEGERSRTATGKATGTDNLTPDTLDDLEWRMLSISEVAFVSEKVRLKFGTGEADQVELSIDEIFLIRVWRPDPEKSWEADSPTRSSLPTLRELVALTMHISAQVDSRLAGAGILIVPTSATRGFKEAAGLPENSEQDPFTEALMDAMITPITDRSSAAAVVPLLVTVPDEAADKVRHISFSTHLDESANGLRDEAIRRLAMGQDAPPELLLGTGGMNHWGAWLVREDVVSTHLEPPLGLICDALTTQYLRPVMESLGYSEEEIDNHVVWYNVDHLISRPSRGQDADSLYERDAISSKALREAHGFDEDDASATSQLDDAARLALEMVERTPALLREPGLNVLVEQLRAMIEGKKIPDMPPLPEPVVEIVEAPAEEDDETPPASTPQSASNARQGVPQTGPNA